MNFQKTWQQTLTDIKVKVASEFDKNFERKAFFNRPWKPSSFSLSVGSLLVRSGKLRRSIKSRVQGDSILFSSNMPYAELQNNGGKIIVTQKMKKYFWAKYLSLQHKKPTQAQRFKAMALKKVGSVITIEKRPFIGKHPKLKTFIEPIIRKNFQQYIKNLIPKK